MESIDFEFILETVSDFIDSHPVLKGFAFFIGFVIGCAILGIFIGQIINPLFERLFKKNNEERDDDPPLS